MKKLMLLFLVVVGTTGCQQYKKLVGGEGTINYLNPGDEIEDIPIRTQHLPPGNEARVLIWGQSNAVYGDKIWERVGAALSVRYSSVTFVNVAVSNTSSGAWCPPSALESNLMAQVAGFQPNIILGIQGEADGSTPQEQYVHNIKALMDGIKAVVPGAYYGMARCSYYGAAPFRDKDPRQAQATLARMGVLDLGPDVDHYRVPQYTEDSGCLHFNDEGDRLIGEEWAQILLFS